jgi:hypothetical protein
MGNNEKENIVAGIFIPKEKMPGRNGHCLK